MRDDLDPGAAREDDLLVSREGGVVRLTLNRPERRNALSTSLWTRMTHTLAEVADDPQVRVVVVSGNGPVFCAGADLQELAEIAAEGRPVPRPMRGGLRNLFEVLLDLDVPTVAELNGPAVAGGAELALACDLRYAAQESFFLQLPEAQRGLGANFASVVLPRLVPRGLALEYLYTSARVPGGTALRLGLLNGLVPAADLRATVDGVVAAIVQNAPLSQRRYKAMANRGWGLPTASALRLDAGPDPYSSHDRAEGVRAFVEKRPPRWEGR